MKRCPECGREYDNTMSFCLDDGAELLYVPASDEPAQADLERYGVPPSGGPTGESHTEEAETPAELGARRKGIAFPLSGGTAAGTSGDCKRL